MELIYARAYSGSIPLATPAQATVGTQLSFVLTELSAPRERDALDICIAQLHKLNVILPWLNISCYASWMYL